MPYRAINRLYLPERPQPATASELITAAGAEIWGKQVMEKVKYDSRLWELQWLLPDKESLLVVRQTVITAADRAGYILL